MLNEQYQFLESLGAGSYGEALLVLDTKQNIKLVAKKISLSGCQPMEVVNKMQEIFILMSLDHANILKYYDRFEDRSNQLLFIVTDYCENGTLTSKLNQEMNENIIKDWFIQMTSAIIYIHSKGIVHRDIKPDNIFLKGNQLKLGDFGLAKSFDTAQTSTFKGTVLYTAPEIFDGNLFTPLADIWSLGIVFYQIITKGKLPFNTIRSICLENLKSIDTKYTQFEQLVLRMLDKEPERRLNSKELMAILMFDAKNDNQIGIKNDYKEEKVSTHSTVKDVSISYKNINCGGRNIGHMGGIGHILELKTGKIASACCFYFGCKEDFTIRLWRICEERLSKLDFLSVLEGHTSWIKGLLELKSGELISYSEDKSIRIWNVDKELCEGVLKHDDYVTCVKELSNGELVSGGCDKVMKVWNIKDKQCIDIFKTKKAVTCLLELKNNELAIGKYEKVILWNIMTKKQIAKLEGHKHSIKEMIQLKNENLVTACSHVDADCKIKIWNVEKRECVGILDCKTAIRSLIELKSGELISGHWNVMKIWNIETRQLVGNLERHHEGVNLLLKLNNDEIASYSNGEIKIWNINTRKCLNTIKEYVFSLIQLNNGDIVSGSRDNDCNSIKIWRAIE